ncbi:MAG: 3-deoxy-manno-octulosonate cytidylyltransferase [Gammaproteobacteria bacterium]|nr:3-deoxy-manno-octulosonate cytidylyltransferase [Gammaproteobacteria bacterium]
MTAFVVVIPARHGSTRLPGKPLLPLAGRPMISHVIARAAGSGADAVIVATDDDRIGVAARAASAEVEFTDSAHASGTDRIAEVARRRRWPADRIVVNLQGDSPLMPSRNLDQVAGLLDVHPAAAVATLSAPIASNEDYCSQNMVKVVADRGGRALYFSRSPIPARAHGDATVKAQRHLGIYAYRVADLLRISATPPCELELCEKLEQLRVLWMGLEIRVAEAAVTPGPDIDTPDDIPMVERLLQAGAGSVR